MKTRQTGVCAACYRTIPAGTEVGFSRARGIRHLGGCAPISTAELLAGRIRYEDDRALRAARKREDDGASYRRHDAANVAVYGERGPGR